MGVAQSHLHYAVDVNTKNKSGGTALMSASRNGHLEIVKLPLAHNSDVNFNVGELTALSFAILHNRSEIAKTLLAHGASANICDRVGGTPLIRASQKNNLAIVEALLAHNADINAVDWKCMSPLTYASEAGHTEVVRALLEHCSDLNELFGIGKTFMSTTALDYAAREGHLDTVRTIFSFLRKKNDWKEFGTQVAKRASDKGHVEFVPFFIDQEVPIESYALKAAAESKTPKLVRLLLEHGSYDLEVSDCYGTTSLMYASKNKDEETVRLLLEHGADVHAKDRSGETALMFAAKNHTANVVRLLLEHGLDDCLEQKSRGSCAASSRTWRGRDGD